MSAILKNFCTRDLIFAVDDWKRLERLLTLGSESPQYRAGATLTVELEAPATRRCAERDGVRVVRLVIRTCDAGRLISSALAEQVLNLVEQYSDERGRRAARRAASAVIQPAVQRPGLGELNLADSRLSDPEALAWAGVQWFDLVEAVLRSRAEPTSDPRRTHALEQALERSFAYGPLTGKRYYVAMDVSGSMSWGEVAGVPGLSPRIAAAGLSLALDRTEQDVYVAAFQHQMGRLELRPGESLWDLRERLRALPFGPADAAQPMIDALEKKLAVDCFVVLTDSETSFGTVRPLEALERYRDATGIPAKLVVGGLLSHGFELADPEDGGTLDLVGFDRESPRVLADFARA